MGKTEKGKNQAKDQEKKITFQETKGILEKEFGENNVGEGFDELVDKAKSEKGAEKESETDGKVSEGAAKTTLRRTPSKKRKAARRKTSVSKTAIKEPEPEPAYVPFSIFDKSLMVIIAGMIPFSILATFTNNEKYLLTEQEKNTLALQWDAVAYKHVPDIIAEYGPEATLASTIGLFLVNKSGVFDGKKVPRKSLKGQEPEKE